MEASHRQTPYVSPEILQQAVADLQETRPGRGILQVVLRATGQALWVALALGAWLRHEYLLFAALSVGAAFWFASFLSLTHDASHHTLTGIRLLDDVIARAVSWPMTWPIATYTQAHLLHHKMNGADPEDPERIQPLARQYERGNRLTRWLLRHQLGFSMFVAGATGLVISLLTRSMFRFRTSRAMRQALIQDAIGISLTTAAIYSAAYAFGGWYLVGGVALHWIIYERCVGVVHQFRVHAEHYGMWDPQANYFDTQYTNARNIDTNGFFRLFYNQLNRHSIHHMFARIPFYHLEEAHRRLSRLYEQAGCPARASPGYLGALREIREAQARGSFIP